MPPNRIYIAAAATALILPMLTACAHQSQTADPAAAPPAAASSFGGHHGLDAMLWMQTSAEFQATTVQTFRLASLRLEQALEDRQWTAALEQDPTKMAGLPPAIIVDVDETILDNSRYQARLVTEGLAFHPETWGGWVQQGVAPALKGAREFLQHASSHGVTVFYVTNRAADHEAATRQNLEQEQMPIDDSLDVVLMNGENGWSSDKTARRQFIAESHRILLLLGDDLNDFVSGAKKPAPEPRRELADQHEAMWGMKWFLFANPGYGSWETSLYGMNFELSESKKRDLKRRHLVPSDP